MNNLSALHLPPDEFTDVFGHKKKIKQKKKGGYNEKLVLKD